MYARVVRVGRSVCNGLALAAVAFSLTVSGSFSAAALAQAGPQAPARSQPSFSAADLRLAQGALAAADRGRWDEARSIADRAGDRLLPKIVAWLEMGAQNNSVPFAEIARFIDDNPDWPGLERLRRRAEEAIDVATPPRLVIAWFGQREPITADGRVALARALIDSDREKEGRAQLRRAWIEEDFNASQEVRFLRQYGKQFSERDHRARLDRLLWDGKSEQAERMLRRVDPVYRPVAVARLRLRAMSAGVDSALRQVPAAYAGDPGLLFERMRWRRRKGRDDDAMEILRNAPKALVRPDRWWPERAVLARRMLAQDRIADALRAVSNHGLTPKDGERYAEAEWMAGWILLRFRKDGKSALPRFERLHEAVRTPASQARAAYWAGRAAKAIGRDEDAQRWYVSASRHVATYYGQLAAHHATSAKQPARVPVDPIPDRAQAAAFERHELTRAAKLFHQLERRRDLDAFMLQLGRASPHPVHKTQAARLASAIGRPDLAVRISRTAYRDGLILLTDGYPVMAAMPDGRPERALLHAVARQESNFDPRAESHAGARGLMQLMPATARGVAKQIRENHNPARLTDPAYNIRLGGAYLGMLLDQFNGSYVLTLGGYNAGPGNVSKWIRAYGDPRDTRVDAVDWIEMIPYTETRDYVQRVLANLQVYRQRLNAPQLASMEQDLRR